MGVFLSILQHRHAALSNETLLAMPDDVTDDKTSKCLRFTLHFDVFIVLLKYGSLSTLMHEAQAAAAAASTQTPKRTL